MNSPNPSATVLYDGQCRFCCRQMDRLRWWDWAGRLEYFSLHDPVVAERWPDVDRERLFEEMCIVDQNNGQHWGAGAVRFLSRRLPSMWWLAPLLHIPGSMVIWSRMYGWVARNRYRLMGKTDECETGTCRIHR